MSMVTQLSGAVWVGAACRVRGRPDAEDNGSMAMTSPFIISLTILDESILRARARSSRSAHRDVIRARIVLGAAEGASNAEIAAAVGVHVDTVRKWLAGLPTRACPDSTTGRAPGGDVPSRPCRSPRSRRWPARCPPRPVSRYRDGQALIWPLRRSPAGWPRRSRRPPYADGWPPMRSNPGSTGPGSSRGTLTSRPRPPECSTCMPGSGRANHWVPTIT